MDELRQPPGTPPSFLATPWCSNRDLRTWNLVNVQTQTHFNMQTASVGCKGSEYSQPTGQSAALKTHKTCILEIRKAVAVWF